MVELTDFVITEKVGSGSYSTVYKAQSKSGSKECVAIKVVEKAKLSSRGRDNIITEIQVMKMLKHKHVVEMKDFIWDANNIYIIMEYCDGGDLSSFIKKRCKLPEKTCQKFLQQLAIGLQFLRSQNIIHLDLKPQNLLLVTKPKITLKIGDFGFAQFLSDSTQETSIRGSPLYMAPEMLIGRRYDARADLWSVGVIAYECLFGKAPYSSGSYEELYSKIKSKEPVVIPSNVNLSKDCKDFLQKLLVHNPEKRMNYEAFFNHPFLNLEYAPSEISYSKAKLILADAEKLDKSGKQVEAFNKYCEGLRYLHPIYQDEIFEDKKVVLWSDLIRFTKRAEQLKCLLVISNEQKSESSCGGNSSENLKNAGRATITRSNSTTNNTRAGIDDVAKFGKNKLMSLCSNTPNLKTALEIGISAQMYLVEGNYAIALEKFESSLGLLLPCLASEPAGLRKELLYLQIQEWMKQAESTKALLSMRESHDTSLISTEYKEMCVIQ